MLDDCLYALHLTVVHSLISWEVVVLNIAVLNEPHSLVLAKCCDYQSQPLLRLGLSITELAVGWKTDLPSDVYWTVHHCDNWRIKNQPDATHYFIVLLIGSTCFGHYYAHHQELATMMLITTLVVSFLVCCMLEVRCGLAGVVFGLQVKTSSSRGTSVMLFYAKQKKKKIQWRYSPTGLWAQNRSTNQIPRLRIRGALPLFFFPL